MKLKAIALANRRRRRAHPVAGRLGANEDQHFGRTELAPGYRHRHAGEGSGEAHQWPHQDSAFHLGSLGGERESIGSATGHLELTFTSTGPVPNFVPEARIRHPVPVP